MKSFFSLWYIALTPERPPMADKWKAAINLVWRAELLPIQIKVPFSDEALL